jgi:thiamine pyrophosphate-dependent acetolactate synthase large subunit-like protein
MRACAFFPPSLDPVLDRGKGDKDAVVAPEVPTCWPVGQAILDHEPHGQVYHAVSVLTAGWGEIGEVGVKVLATLRTVVLRIGDDEIAWTPEVEIAQIVQRPLKLLVPIG